MASLTLEPIAAIQLAIPERFRMLNIALIDVGAGTSDISITNDGCIIAYGMIPVAGDILTETIAKHCLVDFAEAERIKREAGKSDTVSYMDIMLLPQTIRSEEVNELLAPVIEEMSTQVADKIMELNGGKPVSAVFIVGGGGKMAGYAEAVAQKLGIAKERVALRGEEVMQNVVFQEDIKKDSLLVTPVGICMNYYEQNNNFIFVSFNGSRIKMYDNNNLTVADVALQAQFPKDGLFPKRGKELTFQVNGKQRMVRGLRGEAAVVEVNGKIVDLNTTVRENDIIVVTESTAGDAAKAAIGDLPEATESICVIVNGNKVEIPKFAQVNGALQSSYYEIQENDEIEMLNYYTVQQIAEFMDLSLTPDREVFVNHQSAEWNTPVYENFTVNFDLENETGSGAYGELSEEETEEETEGSTAGNGKVNSSKETTEQSGGTNTKESTETSKEEGASAEASDEEKKPAGPTTIIVVVNRSPVTLSGKPSDVFVDVFDKIDFDLTRPKGKNIVTSLNGKPAQYMQTLHDGDVIDIYWSN